MYWLWLLFWVQCVWLATRIGTRKGQPGGAFFVGLMLGPVGVLVVLASSRVTQPKGDAVHELP